MNRWREQCRELRVIFDETGLYQGARHLAMSLGFEAFVFALVIPAASLHRPLFRLYGLPPLASSPTLYDAMRRATRGTLAGASWSVDGARESCPWLAPLPASMAHGWSQPTRQLGTELGMASLARTSPLGQAEADELEPRIALLAQTIHAQLMTIIVGRGDLYDPLSVDELAVLRWAAEGKTAEEIAQLMGLEKRRVIYLTLRARNKMRASSTIQAVIRAQGYGLF